jgi:hypothetical protein
MRPTNIDEAQAPAFFLSAPEDPGDISKAVNARDFIVYNDRENLLFSPVLTFEQKLNTIVFIEDYEVLRLVSK